MNNENQIKADAIMGFINMMIGAFDSGFVDKNNPTLSEIYQTGKNYCHDHLMIDVKNIVDAHGEDLARDCGLGFLNLPNQNQLNKQQTKR